MSAPNDQDAKNSSMDAIDEGWGDASDASESSDSSSDNSSEGDASQPDAAPRRRKRRRRRGGGAERVTGGPSDGSAAEASAVELTAPVDGAAGNSESQRGREANRDNIRDGRRGPARDTRTPQPGNRPSRDTRAPQSVVAPIAERPARDTRGPQAQRPPREARDGRAPAAEGAGGEARSPRERRESRRNRDGGRDGAQRDVARASQPTRRAEPTDAQARSFAAAAELRSAPMAVPQRRDDADDNDPQESTATDGPWGIDDDSPIKEVTWTAEFPSDSAEESPSTSALAARQADLSGSIANVTAVRFSPNGRITWFDAGTLELTVGSHVIVDSERGPRSAVVAVPPQRRVVRDRNIRRVIGVATEADRNRDAANALAAVGALRIAKDRAAALKLPLKVFRAEYAGAADRGGKLFIYFTTDERIDVREFLRQMSNATNARVELRQLGVRDEAKAVGGIGSCGLTLCCSTWLPDFVPVSIKMAKDQGLVLNPSKVSGQCGRLKCCLVYEQAGYAEMRKGLPKLGKRVISPRGEGRVVEVDVLRQRIRVSYGPGETEMLPATEVKPLFPSGNQPKRGPGQDPTGDDNDDDNDDSATPGDLPNS